MNVLITGGCGFIGSNFIRYMINKHPRDKYNINIINIDKLTYAGKKENLSGISKNENYSFVRGDICDETLLYQYKNKIDIIINFAAESHVDNSLNDPSPFIQSNIVGVKTLLNFAKENNIKLFVQISTDEVYGSVDTVGERFKETDRLNPSSPYSSSKASADLIAMSYYKSFGVPVIITRSTNNYGPYQHSEKLIPLFITNAIGYKHLPIYGDGLNIRDWIHVKDNCRAIDMILHRGKVGEIYNIAGNNLRTNLDITQYILSILNRPKSLMTFVEDRKAHDRIYAIDSSKIKKEIGFEPEIDFERGIIDTIYWYLSN